MTDLEIINQRLQAKKDEFTEELSYSEKAVLRAIILEYEQLIEKLINPGPVFNPRSIHTVNSPNH